MKENIEQNEALLTFMEGKQKEGMKNAEIREAAIKHFKVGGTNPKHTLRAWLARLNDKNKYGGRYVERVAKFMQQRPAKTNGEPVVQADAVVTLAEPQTVEAN